MEKKNVLIKRLQQSQIAISAIPGLNLPAGTSIEKARLILQKLQSVDHVSYLKNIQKLKTHQCHLDPSILYPMYFMNGWQFRRNSFGETILNKNLRIEKWDLGLGKIILRKQLSRRRVLIRY